jgi:predicted amidohydrolase
VVVGAPVGGPAQRSNSAIALCRGRVAHRQDKLHLPSYPPFDEGRSVTPATEIGTFDQLRWRLAILICEDAWHIGLTERLAGLGSDRRRRGHQLHQIRTHLEREVFEISNLHLTL